MAKVWWQCPQGHVWLACIAPRSRGGGCPICVREQNQSAPEKALVADLKVWLGQDAAPRDYAIPGLYWRNGMAIRPDFMFATATIKFVVEYDGRRYHSKAARTHLDRAKTVKMEAAGFVVIRIREQPLPLLGGSNDFIVDPSVIYQDHGRDFLRLVTMARSHIDNVCQSHFGSAWTQLFAIA